MEGERQPAPHGGTVDGGDHGDGELVEAGVEVGKSHLGVIAGLEPGACRWHPGRSGPAEIGSRGEPPPCSGQDRCPVDARPEGIERTVHPVKEFAVDGVEAIRPIQCEERCGRGQLSDLHGAHLADGIASRSSAPLGWKVTDTRLLASQVHELLGSVPLDCSKSPE